MAFRNVIIETPATITLQNGQLVIHTDKDHSVATEDLSALLLESRQSSISTAALSQLGQCGCAVYICDEKHLPCAVLTPFNQHSRTLSVFKSQLGASEPIKKRLWQSVVKEKIRNQSRCLQLVGMVEQANRLLSMVEHVRSGDVDNVEATAAQYYFPTLFGAGFTRGDECGINARLNYGYAVLRGCVARSLAVYGFHPALGIHHRSNLNAFNLADDLIEPFRPVVDLLVAQSLPHEDGLTPTNKHALFNCLNLDILSGGQHHNVAYAIERTVQSFSAVLAEKGAALILPELLPTMQHRYE